MLFQLGHLHDLCKHCHVFEGTGGEGPLSFEAFIYDMKRTDVSQTRHEGRIWPCSLLHVERRRMWGERQPRAPGKLQAYCSTVFLNFRGELDGPTGHGHSLSFWRMEIIAAMSWCSGPGFGRKRGGHLIYSFHVSLEDLEAHRWTVTYSRSHNSW